MSEIKGDGDRAGLGINLAGVKQLNGAYEALIHRRGRRSEVRKRNRRANIRRGRKHVAARTRAQRNPSGALRRVGSVDVAPPTSASLNGDWIFPWTNLLGVRSGPEFCARAQMLSETPIAAAIVPLEILRSFEFITVRFSCSSRL